MTAPTKVTREHLGMRIAPHRRNQQCELQLREEVILVRL